MTATAAIGRAIRFSSSSTPSNGDGPGRIHRAARPRGETDAVRSQGTESKFANEPDVIVVRVQTRGASVAR